jgi:hypothetical protein
MTEARLDLLTMAISMLACGGIVGSRRSLAVIVAYVAVAREVHRYPAGRVLDARSASPIP